MNPYHGSINKHKMYIAHSPRGLTAIMGVIKTGRQNGQFTGVLINYVYI